MPDPAQVRTARSRARAAGKAVPCPLCPKCGCKAWGKLFLPLCSKCGKKTPEGKAAEAARKRKARQKLG